jgi:hypothetical protein
MFPAQMSVINQQLAGKMVADFGNVTANDIPMDAQGAIFVKADGTEIQRRIWGNDGIIRVTSYFPQNDVLNQNTNTLSSETEKLKFEPFNEVTGHIERIEERLEEIYRMIEQKEGVENEPEHDIANGNAKTTTKRLTTGK